MNFKPFYIKYENWMTDECVASILDRSAGAGATIGEGVKGIHNIYQGCTPRHYRYFGVNASGFTYFSDVGFNYGENSVEIKLEQVDAHLGLNKPKEITDLTNCAVRITDENGILDVDKLSAVLVAAGESLYSQKFSQSTAEYLLIDEDFITVSDEIPDGFKLVDFKYKRELEWSATMTEEREIVMIGGEEYYADKVDAMFAAMKEAKVDGEVSVMGGGGTPPELPPKDDPK